MVEAFIVDSAVLIDHLRGVPGQADATRFLAPLFERNLVALHPVVLAEVLSGARDARHLRALDRALAGIRLLRIKADDFQSALDLLRSTRLATGIGWPDCLIAATATRLALPLVTTNDKHFRSIRGLRLVRPY